MKPTRVARGVCLLMATALLVAFSECDPTTSSGCGDGGSTCIRIGLDPVGRCST
jgi:hypothetical protein